VRLVEHGASGCRKRHSGEREKEGDSAIKKKGERRRNCLRKRPTDEVASPGKASQRRWEITTAAGKCPERNEKGTDGFQEERKTHARAKQSKWCRGGEMKERLKVLTNLKACQSREESERSRREGKMDSMSDSQEQREADREGKPSLGFREKGNQNVSKRKRSEDAGEKDRKGKRSMQTLIAAFRTKVRGISADRGLGKKRKENLNRKKGLREKKFRVSETLDWTQPVSSAGEWRKRNPKKGESAQCGT